MKNPVELQPLGSNRLFIVPAEKSSDQIPFIPLGDVPLDFVHSPMIQSLVGEPHGVRITDSTYVVNRSIAVRMY